MTDALLTVYCKNYSLRELLAEKINGMWTLGYVDYLALAPRSSNAILSLLVETIYH